jgi:hypothetical protein
VNPGWKYANEFRDETNGEGDAAQTYTYFKVTKVPSLPTNQMPVATTQDKKPAMKSEALDQTDEAANIDVTGQKSTEQNATHQEQPVEDSAV